MATETPAAAPTLPGSAEDLARLLTAKKREHFEQRASNAWARTQPVASDAEPSSCLRRQVLEVVAWQLKEPFPPEAAERMAWGDEAERAGLALLEEMRVRVTRQQSPFQLRHRKTGQVVLSGKIDGVIQLQGAVAAGARGRRLQAVLEIKKLQPWVFDKLDSAQDLLTFWWTRKFLSQMQAYLIGEEVEWGVFFVTDGARWKFLPVELDFEHAEAVWSNAERAVDAIAAYREADQAGLEPPLPPFTTDLEQCRRCSFFGRACNPPVSEMGAELLADPQLEEDLLRREECKDAHRDYESADGRVKKFLKALVDAGALKDRGVCGDFAIEVETQNVKAQPAKPASTRRVIHIERVLPGDGGAAQEGA
jgi:hypothetical protein